MKFYQVSVFALTAAILMISAGCAKKSEQVGFISDYSKLAPVNDTMMRYLAPDNALAEYDAFIIDPVQIHFHAEAEGVKEPAEEAEKLAIYMRGQIVDAISDTYKVVTNPGPRVARVRIALTDIKKSSAALNIIPTTKLTGAGLGGAAMEGEVVDSQTGEQIGAMIDSRLGERLSLDGISDWGDAKAVIDGWAEGFRERLDEAHGH